MLKDFTQLAFQVGQTLFSKKMVLSTAESCTGGWVSQVITSIPGSSLWFDRGFVTYTDQSKREMLGVRLATVTTHGAVSEQTAREMAEGVLRRSYSDVSLAITGIAGPDGGTPEKPVGLVWFAWATRETPMRAESQLFKGNRTSIRAQAVEFALLGLLHVLKH